MEPLISIIIPTYNRAYLIGETLESVIAQTYTNWECLVVDDGSTDHTEKVIQAFINKDNRIKFYKRPIDRVQGGNAARNFGFESSKGEYIQWFDSDDVMLPNLLEKQLHNIIQNNKKFSICLYNRYNTTLNKVLKPAQNNQIKYNIYFDYLIKHIETNLPTILFHNNLLQKHNLSETLYKSQEYEFLQRVFKEHHAQGVLLNSVLVKVRRHKNSISETISSKKTQSALDALLLTFKNLPLEYPIEVKAKIAMEYLRCLYIVFSNKMGSIFYKYLFKLPYFGVLKAIISIPFLGLLYVFVHSFKIGTWHYKYIYKLYE